MSKIESNDEETTGLVKETLPNLGVDYFNSITNFRHNITQSGEHFQQQKTGQEIHVTIWTDPLYNFDKRGAGGGLTESLTGGQSMIMIRCGSDKDNREEKSPSRTTKQR